MAMYWSWDNETNYKKILQTAKMTETQIVDSVENSSFGQINKKQDYFQNKNKLTFKD